MAKTTFSYEQFLMVKYCQNKLKFLLVVEKDRSNTWGKNLEKRPFFGNFFFEVSVFATLTVFIFVLKIFFTFVYRD
jgi:hypothetical protein